MLGRKGWAGVAGAFVLAALVGASLGWPVWRHDIMRLRFDRAVGRVEWPNAHEVARRTEFGLLWCCSNHCDLRTRVLLDGAVDPEEVQRMTFPATLGGAAWARVVPPDDEEDGPTEREEREAWRREVAPSATLVEIVAQSTDELDMLDVRCH
ncbi:MAG: hypothetical protein KC621_13885 [Myxococcales bacterium]|nr:hypothetical protein [Myxococcales bacterium]